MATATPQLDIDISSGELLFESQDRPVHRQSPVVAQGRTMEYPLLTSLRLDDAARAVVEALIADFEQHVSPLTLQERASMREDLTLRAMFGGQLVVTLPSPSGTRLVAALPADSQAQLDELLDAMTPAMLDEIVVQYPDALPDLVTSTAS